MTDYFIIKMGLMSEKIIVLRRKKYHNINNSQDIKFTEIYC